MSLLSVVLWIAGIAAGVMAVVQLSRQSVRLREELEELRAQRPAEPAAPAKARADARPMFGELYEAKPGPLDGLANWPGVPLALAAAGLFAIGMVTGRPRQAAHGQADSTVAVELAAARMRHDSLASEVNQLRDSLTLLQKRPAPAVATARSSGPRPITRAGTTALARPAAPKASGIAPLPSLPKVDGAP